MSIVNHKFFRILVSAQSFIAEKDSEKEFKAALIWALENLALQEKKIRKLEIQSGKRTGVKKARQNPFRLIIGGKN